MDSAFDQITHYELGLQVVRRIFRIIGGVRFIGGAIIVAIALLNRELLGEFWTAAIVLPGAAIAVSGLLSIYFILIYYFVITVIWTVLQWLIFEFADGATYFEYLQDNPRSFYGTWLVLALMTPFILWQLNRSWHFMVRHGGLDEEPSDTPFPELHAYGMVEITGDVYLAAATITEQGLILDRRNFTPVVLPWKWVRSIKPSAEAPDVTADVSLRNDANEMLTVSVPWNKALLEMTPRDLGN